MLKTSLLLAVAGSLTANVVTAQYVPLYGQCGGAGFLGPFECQPPYACVYLNYWYSQCLKWDGTQTTVPPPKSTSAQSTSGKSTTTSLSSDKPPPSSPIPSSSSTSKSVPPTTSTTSTRPGVTTTSSTRPGIVTTSSTRPGVTTTTTKPPVTSTTTTSTKPSVTSTTTSTKPTITTKPTSTATSTKTTSSTRTCTTTTTSRKPIATIRWPVFVPIDGIRYTKFELNELPSGKANVAKTGIDGSFEVSRPILGGPIIVIPWPLDPCNPRIRYLDLDLTSPFSFKPVVWTDEPKFTYWVVPQKGLVSTSPYSPYKEVSTFLACGPDAELYLQTGEDVPTDLDCEKIVLEYDGEDV